MSTLVVTSLRHTSSSSNNVVLDSGGNATFAGNMLFNSGFGSAAIAYGCRAWVCYSFTSGVPAIIASGNVSSLTDVDVGDTRINFSTSMPDANYIFTTQAGGVTRASNLICAQYNNKTAAGVTVSFVNNTFNNTDAPQAIGVAIFR